MQIFHKASNLRYCCRLCVISEEQSMRNKNILVVIENGIIALDIRKQLNSDGYNTEIINPAGGKKLEEVLKNGFQLMIIEKHIDDKGIIEAARLAKDYNIPTIFLSTDNESADLEKSGFRILMLPFGENDLKQVVRIALGDVEEASLTSGE